MRCVPSALALLIGLLPWTAALAEQSPYDDAWRWSRFDEADGLPSTHVYSLRETRDGVVWVKTRRGLAWFDGFGWNRVEAPDGPAFERHTVMSLDAAGGLLVVHHGRLWHYDRDRPTWIDVQRDGRSMWVTSAARLADGALLVSDANGDLFRHDGTGTTAVARPHPSLDPAWVPSPLRCLRDGSVLLHTRRGVFERRADDWTLVIDRQVDLLRRSAAGLQVARSVDDGQRHLWAWKGDDRPAAVDTQLEHGAARAADVAPDGHALAVYTSGMVRALEGGSWQWLTSVPAALSTSDVILFDQDGDLWTVSAGGVNLCRRSLRRWENWEDVGPHVNVLIKSTDGDYWIGSSKGLVIRHGDGTVERLATIDGQELGVITGLAQDEAGAIWVSSGSTFTGAYRWANGTWSFFGPSTGLPAARYHRVVVDRAGRPWFLGHPAATPATAETPDPGAYRYVDGGFQRWAQPEGLPHGRMYDFAETPDGARWFATHAGISRWLDGEWTHWGVLQGLKVGRTFTLTADRQGRMWFGHYNDAGGVGCIDQADRVSYLTVSSGLIDDRVWDVAPGDDGRMWIATSGGLACYADGIVSTFDQSTGLPDTYLWPLLIETDRVLVGTLSMGVIALNLAETANPPPRVHVRPAVIREDNAGLSWTVRPYRGEQAAAQVATRHRFDGGSWSSWSVVREATALSCGVGVHAVDLQAKGLFGQLGPVTTASFRIRPPWYRHPLFLATIAAWLLAMVGMFALSARRRRQQLELLRASEERYRSVVEDQTEFIVRWRPDGTCTFVNAAYSAYFGVPPGGGGASIFDPVIEEDRASLRARLAGLVPAAPTCTAERRVQAPDGAIGYHLWTDRALFNGHGAVIEYQSVGRDITQQKLEETRRQSLERQLREAQKMEAVGQLAAGMSHEFNNFLTALLGYAEIAAERVNRGEPVMPELEGIRAATEQALDVTRSLLTFCRRSAMSTAPVHAVDVVRGAVQFLKSFLPAHISLTLEDGGTDGLFIAADPTLVRQVVVNLALNARDAMPQGGALRIVLHHAPSPAGGHGRLVLEVIDQGPGVPHDIRERIFEPFFTTKAREQGTGLGLAIVHGIVTEHGGRVTVDSEEGCGTTMTVTLPCCAPEPLAPTGASALP